jgi:hypothetical protein
MSAFILLDVPHVGQREIGGQTGHASHSEQNGCWYASTCMVSYFWEAGPRLGVPEQYAANPRDPEPMGARYATLKKNERFEGVPLPASKKWTINKLYNVLENYGPCYVRRGYRNKVTGNLDGGHAVVLIGANLVEKEVCILDPWFSKDAGSAGVMAPTSFDRRLQRLFQMGRTLDDGDQPDVQKAAERHLGDRVCQEPCRSDVVVRRAG